MKLLLSTITLPIALSTFLATADPAIDTAAIEPFDASSCPLNVLSCSPDSRNINACCLPSMGLIALVQQWYPNVEPSNAFTLHGLWPDTCAGGHGPLNGCDDRRVYNNVVARLQSYKGIQPGFMDEMTTYWGSYNGDNDNNHFWSHEWSKHGTCISNLSPSCSNPPSAFIPNQDVYEYFHQGLELRAQYDIYNALAKAGILPGSNPDVEDMHEAIQKAFGVGAQINCEGGMLLKEVWLYFNVKNGNQYVPTSSRSPGSCRGYISYPVKNLTGPSSRPRPPAITTEPTGVWPTRAATTTTTTTTTRKTTTGPAKPTRTGVQTGPCSSEGATVCINHGVSGQFWKCSRGRWIVNECRAGKVCYTDTAVLTHCG